MKKTLQKILNELNKPDPRLDYIKGMLEVLVDEEESLVTVGYKDVISNDSGTANLDEGSMLDAMAVANLATVQRLSQQSND